MSKFKLGAGRKRVYMPFVESSKGSGISSKHRVMCPVWVSPSYHQKEQVGEFVWPEYKTDRERIIQNTHKWKNETISDALCKTYGVTTNLSSQVLQDINSTPPEVKVGDVLKATVESVSKDTTVLSCLNLKQLISSTINLYRFENFKKFIPKEPISVKVTATSPNKISVDPLAPLMDEWVQPILKDTSIQKSMSGAQTIKVKNLKPIVGGGFVGRAVIPNISKYVGEDYMIEAFIPGSQIVLNIEKDFSKWVGKTVDAFVTNYMPKPYSPNQMSLICSVKEYLKFEGEKNLIEIFNAWCDDDEKWKEISERKYLGTVTGIINTSKKCGVFVEIPELNVTGMIPVQPNELVNYKPQTQVTVSIANIEEEMYYDESSGQMKHNQPYVIENGVLKSCSLKPVLKFA